MMKTSKTHLMSRLLALTLVLCLLLGAAALAADAPPAPPADAAATGEPAAAPPAGDAAAAPPAGDAAAAPPAGDAAAAPPAGGGPGGPGGPMEQVAASVYFSDVTGDGVDAVDYCYEQGYISGLTAPAGDVLGTFGPDASIKRGDFVLMLTRAMDLDVQAQTAFSDVPASAYYAEAIGKAAAAGLVTGGGDGTFGPENNISRQEAAVILCRAADLLGAALVPGESWVKTLITDYDQIADWAAGGVLSLTASGVFGSGEFAPAADCTRLDLAMALAALVQTDLTSQQAPQDYDEVFVVVHTNDVHGYIQTEPLVKPVADYYKGVYGDKNVITVSAGDIYAGGAAVAHYYQGELIPGIMNAAGYDYVVPGNNDFNIDREYPGQYEKLAGMGEFTTLAANMFRADADGNSLGEYVFDPYTVFTTAGGAQVGLYGLAMVGGGGSSSEGDGPFYAGRDDLTTSTEMVTQLQDLGCTVIIGLGHKGWNDIPTAESEVGALQRALAGVVDQYMPLPVDEDDEEDSKPPMGGEDSGLLGDLTEGLDAFIDGHSHSIIEGGYGWTSEATGCLVTQAGEKGNVIGVLKLYLQDGAVVKATADLLDAADLAAFDADPATQALVDAAYAQFAADTAKPVGDTPYDLNAGRLSGNNGERGIRTDEQNLGDLVADAVRWKLETDVAFVSGVGLRASIPAGPISLGDWFGVFANGGSWAIVEMTGQELIEALAGGLSALPGEAPSFNQVSGVSFGYLYDDDQITIVDPKVGGTAIDPEATYTVAKGVGGPDATDDVEILIDGMEAAAQVVVDYMATDACQLLPDVVRPDGRINPVEEVPAGAVSYVILRDDLPNGP